MCKPAPVARTAWWGAVGRWGNKVKYLGIVGDDAHKQRRSHHNCGQYRGYDPEYSHALDIGILGDTNLGNEIRDEALKDPRVDHVIFNRQIHYRNGRVGRASGHTDHVHITFGPGTTHSTAPFFKTLEWDEMATEKQVEDAAYRGTKRALNEGTPKGTTSWAQGNKNMAAGVQTNFNLLTWIKDKLSK